MIIHVNEEIKNAVNKAAVENKDSLLMKSTAKLFEMVEGLDKEDLQSNSVVSSLSTILLGMDYSAMHYLNRRQLIWQANAIVNSFQSASKLWR